MAWVRLSDDFYDHPKMADLTPMALALWAATLAWCNRNLTDGLIPARAARRLLDFDGLQLDGDEYDARSAMRELVDADLWEWLDDAKTVRVIDYLDYQPSRESVESKQRAARERMARARERRKGSADVRANDEGSSPNPNPNPKPKKDTPRARRAETDETFDRFWQLYPKKVGKKAARSSFDRAARDIDAETIIAGARAAVAGWNAAQTEPRFIPNPSTWLNQGRWEDEPQLPASSSTSPTPLPVDPSDPEPDPVTDPDEHLAWRKRRAAARQTA